MILIEDNKIEKQVTFIKRCQMKIQLSKEQKTIVGFKERMLIVKGTAGSGKTLVGLARADSLSLNVQGTILEGTTEKREVLFLSFNNSLVNEIKDKYSEYFGENKKITFETYDKYFFNLIKTVFLKSHKGYKINGFGSDWLCNNFKSSSRKKMSQDEIDQKINCVNLIKDGAKDLGMECSYLVDELRYIMANGFTEKEYLEVLRKNRKRRIYPETRKKVYEILKSYRNMLNEYKRIDTDDMYYWFLSRYLAGQVKLDEKIEKEFNDEISRFDVIIVDESQDLDRVKIRILLELLNKYSNIKFLTFLYDVSQSIYPNSYFASITSFKSIGIDRKQIRTLGFSYRSTRQIHQCAYSLLSAFEDKEDNDEVRVKPIFGQNDEGIKPLFIQCKSMEDEGKLLGQGIKIMEEKYNYKPDEIIGIIQNYGDVEIYINSLKDAGIDSIYLDKNILYEYNCDGKSVKNECSGKIRIYNPYNVKGLEAKVIFMIGNNSYNDRNSDEEVAKYYYVQMTRAMELLFILSVGEANKFIQSIDENYLSKLEYGDNLNIEEIIDSNIKIQKAMIESNKLPRYTGVEENLEKKTELEKEYQKKLEQKEKELQNSNISGKLTIEDYDKKVREEMGELPDEVLKNIALGLYYSEQIMDIETAYGKYAKALELVLKEIYKDTIMTLGEMVHNLEDNKDYKQFAKEIIKLGFIKIRNLAIHSSLDINNKKDLLVIQDYIFKDKKLVKLYDKILAVKERDDNKNPISKIGSLITKGCKSKIHGKEFYLYLIDNEEFGACSRLVKDGVYEMNGKYQQSNGKDIFIIDSYKCCKEPEITIQ
ncbi:MULTISPECIES: UvrD-helicase domain-containing protein [unclassified Fusobacterium]|uniref:UvrD-helicase domain-containing protein n=1 Tax=unclassified Fusobacterium TaxID=2648384 RepID=UPI0032C44D8F